ncbi:MAG TPA: DUF5658 family protein [Bryobacteraceae bacterium]|nr:DUF5658 family protein [Bryobacteraceae bacterium]
MTTSLLIFSYFQVLDLLTTVIFLMQGVQEANPLVKFALRAAPSPLLGLVLVKVAAIALGLYCWRIGRRSLLVKMNVLFALLVSWNLVAVLTQVININ